MLSKYFLVYWNIGDSTVKITQKKFLYNSFYSQTADSRAATNKKVTLNSWEVLNLQFWRCLNNHLKQISICFKLKSDKYCIEQIFLLNR